MLVFDIKEFFFLVLFKNVSKILFNLFFKSSLRKKISSPPLLPTFFSTQVSLVEKFSATGMLRSLEKKTKTEYSLVLTIGFH